MFPQGRVVIEPPPDIGADGWDVLSRMYFAPIQHGFFGWRVSPVTLQYLERIGCVRLFYDWDARRVKAEMTTYGRKAFDREVSLRQTNLSNAYAAASRGCVNVQP